MTDAQDKRDDEVLAAEYALHLLEPEERRAFEDRLAGSPDLFALVRAWDEDFVGMATGFAETAPSARVKRAIEKRLFADGTRRGFSLMGLLGGALAAAAVAFALFIALPLTTPEPDADYAATIAAEDGSFAVQASYDSATGALTLERRAGEAPPGRVLELWLIAEGAPAPVSLGLLPEAQTASVVLPGEIRQAVLSGTLAISEEPPGGSPTGAPTGQVLGAGAVTSL
ncbi:anti-sigma factor [Anianabacter salinae]|uniref:anti-sigma factor n=1 Tax=Anianabacter salinae TaxID=2851023 RepID=UPI00225E0A7A|nr:anti-sigma factor [Anianabacter salinae]MBV0911623.1 anti-sigma factor [Anianabacter salinae]